MKEIAGIYKITNPDGKIYIGRSINIYKRWREHKYKTNSLIYRSINKHGYDRHKFEIIHIVDDVNHNELNELEIYYISLFNSSNIKIGLNLCDGGGRLGFKHSDETIEKMKKNRKGWQNSLGRVLSDETKQKISNSLKGNKLSQKSLNEALMTRMDRGTSNIILNVENGVFYYSLNEALKTERISFSTLKNRWERNKYHRLIKV